jgi:hypothetical protein
MEMASFIALLFAKNMALLPLGEPKIGTENDLATLALRRLRRLRRSLEKQQD